MANAQVIAREALKELVCAGIDPTPDAYAKAYNNQAKKLGANFSEIDFSLDKILEMLEPEPKESLFSRKFKNKNELISTMVKAVNLLFFSKKNFNTSLDILKILLRFISTHPKKEIANLAKGHLLEVDKLNTNSMQMWKERWMEQVKKLNETEVLDLNHALEILTSFKIEHVEFKKWQDGVRKYLKEGKTTKMAQLKCFAHLEDILKDILTKAPPPPPEAVKKEKPQEEPKKQIEGYKNTAMLPIDANTTLMSQIGMQEVLRYAEGKFLSEGKNYSVIAFGITKYSKVKETYGEEAAKKILMTLGRLLKRYSNENDLIAYYGNDEFLACLLEREKEEAVRFICDLDSVVQKSVFMFQNTRIDIALSAQASHRNSASSLDDLIKTTIADFANAKDSKGIIQNKNLQ